MKYNRLFPFGLGCLCLSANPASAIIIAGYAAETNSRFANDPSFVASEFDLSGVAIDANGKWLTMISPNVFISAEHFKPATGASVTFHASNDLSGPFVERTVSATSQQVSNSDLWVGTLSDPLPSSYAFYDFATEPITNSGQWNSSLYNGQNAYLFGKVSGNMAVGRNDTSGILRNLTDEDTGGTNAGDALITDIDSPGVTFEATLQVGDSGGPLFVDIGGSLILAGINWFVVKNDFEVVVQNGHSYTGNFSGDIQSFLDVHSVPEPSTYAAILAVFALSYAARRRRSTQPNAATPTSIPHSRGSGIA